MIPYTTLKDLREADACKDRYKHLKTNLGEQFKDNTPIPLVKILEINGLADALWVPDRIVKGDDIQKRYRLFAVACCQDVLHLMRDQRSLNAVKIAHLYAYGEASKEELSAARAAAGAAAWAAAGAAAWDAARAAAWDAARDAAWDATRAARYTWAAALEKQPQHFKLIFSATFVD